MAGLTFKGNLDIKPGANQEIPVRIDEASCVAFEFTIDDSQDVEFAIEFLSDAAADVTSLISEERTYAGNSSINVETAGTCRLIWRNIYVGFWTAFTRNVAYKITVKTQRELEQEKIIKEAEAAAASKKSQEEQELRRREERNAQIEELRASVEMISASLIGKRKNCEDAEREISSLRADLAAREKALQSDLSDIERLEATCAKSVAEANCLELERANELPVGTGVRIHKGFTEHAYRLVFNYEDRYDVTPHLQTILPSGNIENDKLLEPKEESALIAYTYTQDIDVGKAQPHLETPYVWRREDGSHAVVQTWPVKYNTKFRETFAISSDNPDHVCFSPLAVQEFKKVIVSLFGEDANAQPVLYAHKTTENEHPTYIGTTQQLGKFLELKPDSLTALGISRLLPDGFVAHWVDGKGATGEKEFHWPQGDQEYALYTKVGWETMACATPLDQFLRDRVLRREDS